VERGCYFLLVVSFDSCMFMHAPPGNDEDVPGPGRRGIERMRGNARQDVTLAKTCCCIACVDSYFVCLFVPHFITYALSSGVLPCCAVHVFFAQKLHSCHFFEGCCIVVIFLKDPSKTELTELNQVRTRTAKLQGSGNTTAGSCAPAGWLWLTLSPFPSLLSC